MKSLGVKLAVGGITVLFGAYAAALAQKDKQSKSSWTAKVPSLGEPATPIADMGDESWLSQPSTETLQAGAPSYPHDGVQLAQHTQPVDDGGGDASPSFDPSSLPPTLGADSDPSVPDANWTLPPDQGTTDPVIDPAAPSMTFPVDASLSMTADVGTSGQSAQVADAPPQADPAQASSDLPALTLSQPPAMDIMASDDGPAAVATGGDQPSPHPEPVTPGNILRDSDPAANVLRGSEDAGTANLAEIAASTFPGTDANLRQNPVGDAPPFDPQPTGQPEAMATPSAAGLGTPAAGGPPFDMMPVSSAPTASPAGMEPAMELGQSPAPAGSPAIASGNLGGGVGGVYPSTTLGPSSLGPAPGAAPATFGVPAGQNAANPAMAPAFDPPATAVAIDPNATIDAPGDRRLEGVQSPSVIIQKRAPAQVKVGRPASFVIHVQNVGTVEALDVQVHDRVPAGMRLVDASPAPLQQDSLLLWQLGAMQAGEERTVTMQLVPEREGELGSVARVSFEAAASVRTISTRPELKISQRAPETVLIGQQLEIELEVSNPGSGEATGVVLQEDVPEGLEHPKGRHLDNGLGTLAPGEIRNQVLRLRAVAPGIVENTIRLTADDGLTAEHTVAVQVVAPDLKVEMIGPSRKYLERQATYELNIANAGTADATNVEIAVQLARGFTFVSTDYEGQYDPSRHAVYWSLSRLPAGESGRVPLTLLAVEEGEQAIVIDARADLGAIARSERTMTVEAFAELRFQISSPGGPIELGSETEYEIRVTNSGSKADSNVRVQLQLPAGLELVSADSEAGTDGRGLVAFQPKSQLPPGDEIKYGLRLRGVAPGTHIVSATVVSDQSNKPVTKEESTVVYADR